MEGPEKGGKRPSRQAFAKRPKANTGFCKPVKALSSKKKLSPKKISYDLQKAKKKFFWKIQKIQKNGYFWREKLNILKSAEFQKNLFYHFDRA